MPEKRLAKARATLPAGYQFGAASEEQCPECGETLEYDEVDIGVGVQRGNYGCPACGWTMPTLPDSRIPTGDNVDGQ